MGYAAALSSFVASGCDFARLPFFKDGASARVGALLDGRAAAGEAILPAPNEVLNALMLTPLPTVRVVILGQDPYPTPGDAHGLSFSIRRSGKPARSLANIFKELTDDVGEPLRTHADLSDWARQGVLLLNTCLTVASGAAGSHRKLGWQFLSDEVISAVSAQPNSTVFVLWGADAQAKAGLIDTQRHCIIASAHPSPLSARRGFFGSRPFTRTNDWLVEKGFKPIIWG